MHILTPKLSRILLVSSFSLLASACVSKQEVMTLKENEAAAVVNVRVTMDGNHETKALNNCFAFFTDKNHKHIISRKDNETGYYVFKADAGKIHLVGVRCSAYKVFYNKVRKYLLKDMYFIAEAGKINYAGDIKAEWESDRLKVGDFFLTGAGDLTSDEGVMQLRMLDRFEEAKQYMLENYPAEGKAFAKTPFAEHEQLTQ